MTSNSRVRLVALSAVALLAGMGAALAESCSDRAAMCEEICTPARIARYYSTVPQRCAASCQPRREQCQRTGIWVHLEDDHPGWHEPVSRW